MLNFRDFNKISRPIAKNLTHSDHKGRNDRWREIIAQENPGDFAVFSAEIARV